MAGVLYESAQRKLPTRSDCSRSLLKVAVGEVSLIELAFDRMHRVLLVRYSLEFTRYNLVQLDLLVEAFVAREGVADLILDFTGVPVTDIAPSLMRERANRATLVPDKQRVFVAPHDFLYGMLRMYGLFQGSDLPVVRTLNEALEILGLGGAAFESVGGIEWERCP